MGARMSQSIYRHTTSFYYTVNFFGKLSLKERIHTHLGIRISQYMDENPRNKSRMCKVFHVLFPLVAVTQVILLWCCPFYVTIYYCKPFHLANVHLPHWVYKNRGRLTGHTLNCSTLKLAKGTKIWGVWRI